MFITFFKDKPQVQVRFEDLFNNFGTTDIEQIFPQEETFPRKITVWNPDFNIAQQPIEQMKSALEPIKDRVWNMSQTFQDNPKGAQDYYDTFYIPKHSGGMRRIDAPKDELKTLLREIKRIFENQLRFLPHDRAFAYVKGRSTKEALMEHQKNESRWFLKLDIKDFFPTCTFDLIANAMTKIFPFKTLLQSADTYATFYPIIKICLLNNSLPQGTPMSPLLTNLIMVPYDYVIYRTFNDFEKQHFVYTRYADDILISSKYDFNQDKIFDEVQKIIAPFRLKPEKTRYGSSAGRNWNLGLMLNKDNEITVGYKQKQRLKAAIFQFLQDFTNNKPWDKMNTQILLGQVSYYQKIEPEYIQHILDKYREKFTGVSFRQCCTQILRQI